jgi:nucleotide-binding universal stress UspA family protein
VADKVTFGDDHSTGSQTAWGWIVNQTWPGWILDIVSIEHGGSPSKDSPLGYDVLTEFTPSDQRAIPTTSGFNEVRYLTAHHDPRVLLGSLPDSTLLVVGPRGRGILKAMHIGSTAEWLMQCPSTPLVIAREASPVRKVLVGMDGSPHAHAAVKLLAQMPWISATSVTIVSIVEDSESIRQSSAEAANILDEAGAQTTTLIVEPDSHLHRVDPRRSLMEIADAQQPDLVVLGTQGLTGLPRMRVGSVASAITHHVPCSVMLVRDSTDDA